MFATEHILQSQFFLFAQFVLRQAATRCGLWENPPQITKVGGKAMERFLNQASTRY